MRERFAQAHQAGDSFAVSTIVVFELRYGAAKSRYRDATHARLEAFLAGPLGILAFDEDDAADAGEARAALEQAGAPIGDVLIAGQARRRGVTVVTANAGEFSRVDGLAWQDWGR